MKTLLSIDGGGLFGIGVANWLPKLENFKFDYYAGTSVGSILAACYAIGKEPGEVQKMFNSDLPKRIFSKPGFPKCLNPLRAAKYGNKEAMKVLQEVFEDRTLKDTKYPLVIVAWNYDKKKEKVFTRTFNNTYLLRDAVLASMSAPTYFPIVTLIDDKEKEIERLGDGGVCGNDPSLAGIAAMLDDNIKINDIKCLSLCTTGKPKKKIIKVRSKFGWLPEIVKVITAGNVSYTSYGVSHILDNNKEGKEKRYLRISPASLPDGAMDKFKLVDEIREAWKNCEHSDAVKFLKK